MIFLRNKCVIFLLIFLFTFPVQAKFTYSRVYFDREVKFTNQLGTGEYGEVSCVPTSVKMILDYQGVKSESVDSMFRRMNGDWNGVNLSDAYDYIGELPNSFSLMQVVRNKDSLKYYIDLNIPYLLSIKPLKIKVQRDDKIPVLLKSIGRDYSVYMDSLHMIWDM